MAQLERFGQALAAFATDVEATPLPGFYSSAFLNWFGCALAGSRSQTVERAMAFHLADAPGKLLPPIGRREGLGASASVLIDCLSSACLAYDDIHFETTLHPTGPVAAAILGLSRCRPVSGADALHALRVGMEVECRVSLAMLGARTGSARGWYPTGIAGGIGAAAAVGRLLGFDAARMETAFGLAAARASGTRGTHGAMSAYWVPAVAAESGYVAARLAEVGFTCLPASLTGANGLVRQMAPQPDLTAALDGLGNHYICEATACKPYPFGFIAHAVIKCCLDLHARQKASGDLDRLVLQVSSTAAMLGNKPQPTSVFDAQVSLQFIAARVLSDPTLAFEPLPEDITIEQGVARIASRVEIERVEGLQDQQCRCLATYRDGSEYVVTCDVAPGAPGNLPSTAEVEAKFVRLASSIVGVHAAEQLLGSLREIHEMADISDLLSRSW
ncbi:MmgE/PrpD family protein [Noviherbaspirillum sedimenti]|uniref:2-methylcitrate dehydratase n=1 Tax=Noviherbaspirillum sedimenti TaxID=2320865 RepID=A0A3A3G5R6_9BURK|nr:MmgE/PrpD family protein [Noviherbaspirillum sedimenti]RJG03281.1 hypothetical protein D3878_18195 [Noviherbaspirillum sedimenti]